MRSIHRLSILGLAVAFPVALLVACGDEASTTDAGTDAGNDTGRTDARADTGGGQDSGGQDSGGQDSGSDARADGGDGGDGGTVGDGGDGGTVTDGGDGGVMDAGPGVNYMVVRVGAGADAGALSNASAPLFLEERSSGGGGLIRTITLPIAVNGNNQPITIAGTSTTEGALVRSGNGAFVTLAGYAVAPGLASVNGTTSAATNRVIARVAANGTIDTTTRIDDAFSAVSIRAAATNDGTAFWAVGGNSGVRYSLLGATGMSADISTTVANNRQLGIFGGQLYGVAQSGTNRFYAVGTGLPTTAMQAMTALAGASTTAAVNGFVLLDLDNQVAGVDTLYYSDESNTNANGGVQKWKFNGTTWAMVMRFYDGIAGNSGCNRVTAATVGNVVHVLCTTLENPSRVLRWIDDGTNMGTPMGTALTTAQPNTQFRGIAISPQ